MSLLVTLPARKKNCIRSLLHVGGDFLKFLYLNAVGFVVGWRGMNKEKVRVCENHLTAFYEAIQAGDIALMDRLEHELTPAEECVACAYLLKTQGSVHDALASYLSVQGFAVGEGNRSSTASTLGFWLLRGCMLFGIFTVVLFLVGLVERFVFRIHLVWFVPFDLLALMVSGFVSLGIFLFIDDLLFD